jgi:hypothetical protein
MGVGFLTMGEIVVVLMVEKAAIKTIHIETGYLMHLKAQSLFL